MLLSTDTCDYHLTGAFENITTTTLINNKQHQTFFDALIHLCLPLCPVNGPMATGFKPLVSDKLLLHDHRTLELSNAKNPNNNPVTERAVQKLEHELLRLDPAGGQVS